jgi:hypothetical protein
MVFFVLHHLMTSRSIGSLDVCLGHFTLASQCTTSELVTHQRCFYTLRAFLINQFTQMFLWCWLMLVVLDNKSNAAVGSQVENHHRLENAVTTLVDFLGLATRHVCRMPIHHQDGRQSYTVLAVLWGVPWSVMME